MAGGRRALLTVAAATWQAVGGVQARAWRLDRVAAELAEDPAVRAALAALDAQGGGAAIEAAQAGLGVNTHDGIVWFDRDAALTLVDVMEVGGTLEALAAADPGAAVAGVRDRAEAWRVAIEGSGYRLAAWRDAVAALDTPHGVGTALADPGGETSTAG
jgi:hypothetical protein